MAKKDFAYYSKKGYDEIVFSNGAKSSKESVDHLLMAKNYFIKAQSCVARGVKYDKMSRKIREVGGEIAQLKTIFGEKNLGKKTMVFLSVFCFVLSIFFSLNLTGNVIGVSSNWTSFFLGIFSFVAGLCFLVVYAG